MYDVFVNEVMIENGYAISYPYEPDTKYSIHFDNLENHAREKEIGCLWEYTQEDYIQDECIHIANLHFNAAGNDNYNLNDEYVTFRNTCSYSIDITSWTVRDRSSYNSYSFPST